MDGELVRRPTDLAWHRQRELEALRRKQGVAAAREEAEIALATHIEKRRIESRAQVAEARLRAGHLLVSAEVQRIAERHRAKSRIRNPDALAAIDEPLGVAEQGAQHALYRYYDGL